MYLRNGAGDLQRQPRCLSKFVRMLAEFGDDPDRLLRRESGKKLRRHEPIIRAFGKKKIVIDHL
jgi:hypothetical protein